MIYNTIVQEESVCTCYRETPVKNFKEVKNKFYIRMLVDNKPGVLAAIASVFGVHKVSIARVIQNTKEDDAAELVIVTEAVKEKHLEDATGSSGGYGYDTGDWNRDP